MNTERYIVVGANCLSSQGEPLNFFFPSQEAATAFLARQSEEGQEEIRIVGDFFPREIDERNKKMLDANGFLEGYFPGHVKTVKEADDKKEIQKCKKEGGYRVWFLNFKDQENNSGYLLSRSKRQLDELRKDPDFCSRYGVVFEGDPGRTAIDCKNVELLKRHSFIEGCYQQHLEPIPKKS